MMGKPPNFTVDVAAAPPLPPPGVEKTMIVGGEYYDQHNNNSMLLSPRYNNFGHKYYSSADFLRSCGLCNRRLAPGRDIYMYRGDAAFCSLECREQQMKQDERKERREAAAAKKGEHHRSEVVAAAPNTAGKGGTMTAA